MAERVPGSPANWSEAASPSGLGEAERLLFAHSLDGMMLIRVEPGPSGEHEFRIMAENPAAIARLRGLGQAEHFAGQRIEDALPPWLARQARAQYTACMATAEARRYEITQPGSSHTHESVAVPVRAADRPEIGHIVVTMRDVAERANQERALNRALAKAEEANRSKSEFFASMSHELRTPLNAILGFSEMMGKGIGGELADRQREYVDHIHNSGQHLLRIISDILDLSKIEAGQFKLQESEAALPPLMEMCLQMVQERARRKGLRIVTEIADELPLALVDPVRIRQILLNLLSNAIKFTDQGAVTLAARFEPDRGFVISVTDTGIGMSAADLKTALEPFGQVEDAYCRNHDGTGLGLPIARHLAELHGGRLEIASRKGAGTCVTVILPPSRAIAAAKVKIAG